MHNLMQELVVNQFGINNYRGLKQAQILFKKETGILLLIHGQNNFSQLQSFILIITIVT